MPIGYSADALVYDSGTNSWSLRPDYDPDLHRVNFQIKDDDGLFDGDVKADEVGYDSSQEAIVTDMSGTPIAKGQIYDEEFYAAWDGVNPHIYIESVEIGGTHIGYIVSEPLTPGTSYSQSATGDVDPSTAAAYSTFTDVPYSMPCYALGTMIDTPQGPQAIETLRPGDQVLTLDHGAQAARWVRHAEQPLEAVDTDAKPVLIKAGSLGSGCPKNDLIVSPQHRILVGGLRQLRAACGTEAFAPAKSLTVLPGIRHMKGKEAITWIHFACDRHEVVTANGCLSESLLLGPMVVNGLRTAERLTVTGIFGLATTPDAALNGPPARVCMTVGAMKRRLAKHLNAKRDLAAKDIRKWDKELATEKFEAERLREARSMTQIDSEVQGETYLS